MAHVRFAVGPVAGELARTWLRNSAAIVAAARAHQYEVSVPIEEPLLDLAEAYLTFWVDAAGDSDVFHWEADVDPDQVRTLAEQWVVLAQLTDDDLVILDCTWAPPETQPFYDALLAGVIAALDADPDTRPAARQLEVDPPGSGPANR